MESGYGCEPLPFPIPRRFVYLYIRSCVGERSHYFTPRSLRPPAKPGRAENSAEVLKQNRRETISVAYCVNKGVRPSPLKMEYTRDEKWVNVVQRRAILIYSVCGIVFSLNRTNFQCSYSPRSITTCPPPWSESARNNFIRYLPPTSPHR